MCCFRSSLKLMVSILALTAAVEAENPAPAPQAAAKPKIALSSELWNFGEVWHGEKLSESIVIRNEGNADLVITRVKASCGCTAGKVSKGRVAPGETTTVEVSFDAAKKKGQVNTQVSILSNDVDRPEVIFYLKGFVKRELDYDNPGGLVMRGMDVNAVLNAKCTVTNKSDRPMKLALQRVMSDKFDVSIREVEPGKVFELTAVSKPPLGVGRNEGMVVVTTGLEREKELNLPIIATIVERVELSPPAILLDRDMIKERTERNIRVLYYGDRADWKITSVEVPQDGLIKLVGISPSRPASAEYGRLATPPLMYSEFKLDLPPGVGVPNDGIRVEVHTNEPGFEVLDLVVTADGGVFNQIMHKTAR